VGEERVLKGKSWNSHTMLNHSLIQGFRLAQETIVLMTTPTYTRSRTVLRGRTVLESVKSHSFHDLLGHRHPPKSDKVIRFLNGDEPTNVNRWIKTDRMDPLRRVYENRDREGGFF